MLSAGCVDARAPAQGPAVIVNANAQSRAELLQSVRAMLHDPPLLLADAALMNDSLLIIERQPRRDNNGQLLDGRESQLPERFLLTLNGKRCILTHERTQKKITLEHTQCQLKR